MNQKADLSLTPYYFFAFLRCFLVTLPQTGYIHPDEFFQSVEVLVGKFYDVENDPPWEFNSTFPIRSMAIPYFTIGMSVKFLRDVNHISKRYFSSTVVNAYNVLLAPRMLMCVLSFLVDYSLYKICANNNEKYKARLLILSLSYVLIVYGTRTFSNTIEMVLFSILLYFVCESLTFSNILNRKREYINYRYDQSRTVAEKAKFHKLRLYLVSDSFRNCFVISTITVCGFFNRPTFLAYAIMPVFFWLYRGIGSKSITVMQFYTRMLFFVLCSLPSFITIIIIDSFFYGYITWGEVGMLDVTINSFVFTPLNFIRYNINTENLAKHGLHPRYLHVLVNIPLLFNVLGLAALGSLLHYSYLCFHGKYNLLPPVKSIKCLMVLSFLTPVLLLSYFPHQEPRFLIPLILPLVYLHGMTILSEPDNILVQVPSMSIKDRNTYSVKKKTQSYLLFKLWLAFNAVLLVFYGFIHQGGVVQAVGYLQGEMKAYLPRTKYHIVTSHIYSTPMSLLLQKSSEQLYYAGENKSKYSVEKRVMLHEEGSKDLKMLVHKINSIAEGKDYVNDMTAQCKNRIFLLLPGSIVEDVENMLLEKKILFNRRKSFFPHISIEAFPNFTRYCLEITRTFYRDCQVLSAVNYVRKFKEMCELIVLEISPKRSYEQNVL